MKINWKKEYEQAKKNKLLILHEIEEMEKEEERKKEEKAKIEAQRKPRLIEKKIPQEHHNAWYQRYITAVKNDNFMPLFYNGEEVKVYYHEKKIYDYYSYYYIFFLYPPDPEFLKFCDLALEKGYQAGNNRYIILEKIGNT